MGPRKWGTIKGPPQGVNKAFIWGWSELVSQWSLMTVTDQPSALCVAALLGGPPGKADFLGWTALLTLPEFLWQRGNGSVSSVAQWHVRDFATM